MKWTEELWAAVADAISSRKAGEVYAAAQRLGLPFGYAADASDLLSAEQLLAKGFVIAPQRRRRDSAAPSSHRAWASMSPVG